jgi:hypothetical protein
MSAIEFFLTRCLQESPHHPAGWEWYVLDREGLHQDILQVLFNESSQFGRTLVGLSGPNICIRQPPNCGGFDLVVRPKEGGRRRRRFISKSKSINSGVPLNRTKNYVPARIQGAGRTGSFLAAGGRISKDYGRDSQRRSLFEGELRRTLWRV